MKEFFREASTGLESYLVLGNTFDVSLGLTGGVGSRRGDSTITH